MLKLFEYTIDRSGDNSPFVIMAKGIEAAVKANAETFMAALQLEFATIIESIQVDFDRMIDNGPPDEKEIPVRAALKGYMDMREVQLDELNEELQEVKEGYGVR